jgi:AmmeMemoRadiSam system protein B
MKKLRYLTIILLVVYLSLAGFILGLKSNQTPTDSQPATTVNLHYPPFTQTQYFDDFFAFAGPCQNNYNDQIKGLIVNHHLLAGNFIAKGLCSVATTKKLTVILLSPNHFNHGGPAITSDYDWYTPYGIIPANQELIKKLTANNAITIEETPFIDEHGVYNITPFIKSSLPDATIVPIAVEDNISDAQKTLLINSIEKNLPADAIIIASLDFSHYLTSAEADKNDNETLEVINNFDFVNLKNLNPGNKPDNVDSKPAFEIFLTLMSFQRAKNFQLLAHSNSAKMIGDLTLPETTSYIVGNFSTN